ncbi:MAG: hypothetical protein P1U57_14165, partial [Oleibacter sp.]|nr:hypothetical protein [Thalassolituus sp.]
NKTFTPFMNWLVDRFKLRTFLPIYLDRISANIFVSNRNHHITKHEYTSVYCNVSLVINAIDEDRNGQKKPANGPVSIK